MKGSKISSELAGSDQAAPFFSFVRRHLFLISYRCHTAQVKLADRNTETFADPKSPHYKSHTKNVIGWQQRERWEIGSEGEQGARDLWKSSGADLFVLGTPSQELFNSLPFFFCLEISKWNIEQAIWVLLSPFQWCVRREKKHPVNTSDSHADF